MNELFSALTYFGLFQGFFLLAILGFSPTHRKGVNPYLMILIGVLILGLMGRALYLMGAWNHNPRLLTISEYGMMLFGPSFALFVRSNLRQTGFSYRSLLHYIPAVLHITYLTNYFIFVSDEVIGARFASGELIRIVLVLGTIGFLWNMGYWIWSWRMFHEFKRNMVRQLSYVIRGQFMFFFLLAIGFCLTAVGIVILVTFLKFELMERVVYMTMWLSLTIVILFLGFYSFTRPEILSVKIPEKDLKYSQSKLENEDLERLKAELDEIMSAKKPYLNKKLMKSELAQLLGVNSREMSRLLNEAIGMNFFEYTNYHRIREFIHLVESGDHQNLTFMGIAELAGFNSKATFNKSFKDIMGKTPREYFG